MITLDKNEAVKVQDILQAIIDNPGSRVHDIFFDNEWIDIQYLNNLLYSLIRPD